MKSFVVVLLSGLCLFVTGCGVKPSGVKPPKDASESAFPRTYPSDNTEH